MASKKSSKSKTWQCEHGCPNDKVACEHLERLIAEPKENPSFEDVYKRVDKPIDDFYYGSGAGIVLPPGIASGRYENLFRAKCLRAGLSKIQTDVLTHVFVYEDSPEETVQEMGLVSIRMFYRLKKEAMAIVKKRGLK